MWYQSSYMDLEVCDDIYTASTQAQKNPPWMDIGIYLRSPNTTSFVWRNRGKGKLTNCNFSSILSCKPGCSNTPTTCPYCNQIIIKIRWLLASSILSKCRHSPRHIELLQSNKSNFGTPDLLVQMHSCKCIEVKTHPKTLLFRTLLTICSYIKAH